MTKTKFVFFIIFLLTLTSVALSYEEEQVKVKARVIKPIKINVIRNLNFGDIFRGTKNINQKDKGEIKITGDGEIKVLWKNNYDADFISINKNLDVKIFNENDYIIANIKSNHHGNFNNFVVSDDGIIIEIEGVIKNVDNGLKNGDYRGNILIRAEYVN